MRKHRGVKRVIHLLIIGFAVGLIATLQMYVSAETKQVSTEKDFLAALADSTVDVIQLTGSIQIGVESGEDEPLVINRAVTIQGNGNEMTLRKAGIILGADVTFQDIQIGFTNTVRNAIIANGYKLTLNKVTPVSSTTNTSIHLFCGGITDYSGSVSIPATGNKGEIIVGGTSRLGNIYAGSFSDGADENSATANSFSSPAAITVAEDFQGNIGEIYAHGARESRGEGEGDLLYPDSSKYKATGGVTINLNNGVAKTIYGATGGDTDAAVIYTDDGTGYQYTPLLDNIGSLALNAGSEGSKADLAPLTGSSLSSKSGAVTLNEKTYLNLSSMGDTVAISSLSGGGTLILGGSQTLNISGEVSGTTSLAIGGLDSTGQYSTGSISEEHAYIYAPDSQAGNIVLLPPAGNTGLTVKRDEQGNWIIPSAGEETILIESMAMPASVEKENGVSEVIIPVTEITYGSQDVYDYLAFIPMNVMVGNYTAAQKKEDGDSYSYSTGSGSTDIEFYFIGNQDGETTEALYIKGAGTNLIAAGEYKFNFTISEQYMKSGQPYSFTVTLTVQAADDPSLQANEITAVEGGISGTYNGSAFSLSTVQGTHFNWKGSGSASIQGYYLDEGATPTTTENSGATSQGGAPVKAGTYYGKVTVAADGTYGRATAYLPFTIKKADLEVQSVPLVSPIQPGTALSSAKINNGVVAIKGTSTSVSGTWVWVNGTIVPTVSGEYEARFIPTDQINFNEIGVQKLSVTVSEIQKAYTIYFKAGEGSGTMSDGTAFEGTYYSLPACTFTAPTGKTFAGWSIADKTYAAGDKYLFTANASVTALWKSSSSAHTHTGGTATCASPAKCTGCGLTYGSKNSSNHTGGTEVRNKLAATATANGYTGDTWCLGCNTKIATGTVIKATGTTTGTTGTNSSTTGTTGSTSGSGSSSTGSTSGSGSSSSGSSSTGSSQTKVADTVSVYGAKNNVKPKASVSGTTATVSTLSQTEITNILTNNTANSVITFDVSGMGTKTDSVNLSRDNLKAFAEASNNGGLRLNLSTGSVKLDQKALKAIVDQSGGDTIRLVLNNAGTSLLNENQKKSTQGMQLHGAVEVYFLSVKDNKRISDLKGGMMTLSLPFSIPSGHSSSNFFVWYIDDSGTRTKLTSWYEGYKIHWQVGHNSAFIISYGSAGATTNTSVKSPKTGDLGLDTLFQDFTAFMVVALVIPLVVIVGIAARNRE
ncbi:MAG: hypothetical protein IJP31_07620 [Lachnospiraceae bacterium]|nr:hypothetical protein [Lachnospiraceae bacterium]